MVPRGGSESRVKEDQFSKGNNIDELFPRELDPIGSAKRCCEHDSTHHGAKKAEKEVTLSRA